MLKLLLVQRAQDLLCLKCVIVIVCTISLARTIIKFFKHVVMFDKSCAYYRYAMFEMRRRVRVDRTISLAR